MQEMPGVKAGVPSLKGLIYSGNATRDYRPRLQIVGSLSGLCLSDFQTAGAAKRWGIKNTQMRNSQVLQTI